MSSDEHGFGYNDNKYSQERITSDLKAKLERAKINLFRILRNGSKDGTKNPDLDELIDEVEDALGFTRHSCEQLRLERDNLQTRVNQLEATNQYLKEHHTVTPEFEKLIAETMPKIDNLQAANGVMRDVLRDMIKIAKYANQQVQSGMVNEIIKRGELSLSATPTEARERVRGLVEALEKLARLGNGDRYGNSIGNEIAQDALAKYRGNNDGE